MAWLNSRENSNTVRNDGREMPNREEWSCVRWLLDNSRENPNCMRNDR